MLLLNSFQQSCLMAKAPVTECYKFVYPGNTNHMLLLCELCDGSGFDIFNAGEVVRWQLLLWGRKKDANCYVPKSDCMENGPDFLTKLQVCCTVCAWGLALSCRTAPLLRQGRFLLMASFKNFSVTQYMSPLAIHWYSRMSTNNTSSPSRKWPALY